jgi:acetylglutamate kinase
VSAAIVVKLGGSTLADQAFVLSELAELSQGTPVVVVHGGGHRVTQWLERMGIATRFEAGRRVTDAAALEVAVAVLRGAVNVELVAALRQLGADAVGISGVDGGMLVGQRQPGLGLVVAVTHADRGLLDALLADGRLPVVAPLALDETGAVCNVNADEAAVAVARGIGAARLVLLTDTDGVNGTDGERIARLDPAAVEGLIAAGVISSGMIPKVRAALLAVADGGAGEAVIADGTAPRALARALGDPGFGSRAIAVTGAGVHR